MIWLFKSQGSSPGEKGSTVDTDKASERRRSNTSNTTEGDMLYRRHRLTSLVRFPWARMKVPPGRTKL